VLDFCPSLEEVIFIYLGPFCKVNEGEKTCFKNRGAANQARAQLKYASKIVTFLEDIFTKYSGLGQKYRIYSRINIQLPG
jgi:hypothetical protein